MKITVAISNVGKNDEHYDALVAVVADAQSSRDAENIRRAARTPPLTPLPAITPQSYLESLLERCVDSYRKQVFDAAVKRLCDSVAACSYAERKSLIDDLQRAAWRLTAASNESHNRKP